MLLWLLLLVAVVLGQALQRHSVPSPRAGTGCARASWAASEVPVRNDFDAIAPVYDRLSALVFGGAIRRAQLALLPELRGACRMLIVGGGTGWFLAEALRTAPAAKVLYIEKSSKMLDKSRRLIKRTLPRQSGRVEFRLGTEESLTLDDGSFDVVITNFFLDLFTDENCLRVARRLHEHMKSGGRWLFVDFEVPHGGVRKLYAKLLYKVMFVFLDVASRIESKHVPDYAQVFAQLGLQTTKHVSFHGRMIHARLLGAGSAV